jgi:hypothetical protein
VSFAIPPEALMLFDKANGQRIVTPGGNI